MYNVFPNLQQVFNSFIMGNNDQHNLQKNLCSSSCSIGALIIFLALCCSSVEDGSTTWAASSATMYDSLRMAAIDARNDAELPAEVCQRYIRSGQCVTFYSFYLDQAWSILPALELPPWLFTPQSRMSNPNADQTWSSFHSCGLWFFSIHFTYNGYMIPWNRLSNNW